MSVDAPRVSGNWLYTVVGALKKAPGISIWGPLLGFTPWFAVSVAVVFLLSFAIVAASGTLFGGVTGAAPAMERWMLFILTPLWPFVSIGVPVTARVITHDTDPLSARIGFWLTAPGRFWGRFTWFAVRWVARQPFLIGFVGLALLFIGFVVGLSVESGSLLGGLVGGVVGGSLLLVSGWGLQNRGNRYGSFVTPGFRNPVSWLLIPLFLLCWLAPLGVLLIVFALPVIFGMFVLSYVAAADATGWFASLWHPVESFGPDWLLLTDGTSGGGLNFVVVLVAVLLFSGIPAILDAQTSGA